ncbi:hypothetical protein FD755_019293 [Muntiacus reevesi]|uniref:PDE8-like REC N-terminal domain-containing protein n=1 Tax=Muntiacus reevesi TaxID=9886 RepID=A0A5N3X824_MUNRE|nr:hypothetical protein FD755_019293 [Muntiacus reevesi]
MAWGWISASIPLPCAPFVVHRLCSPSSGPGLAAQFIELNRLVAVADVQFGPMRFHPDQLQVLLVFTKEDNQCNGFCRACEKAGFMCTVTKEAQTALACFLDKHHDIIIIDHRNSRHLDAEALCSIKSFQMSQLFTSGDQSIGDGLVGSPCNPRDSQESSPIPRFKSINSSVQETPAVTGKFDRGVQNEAGQTLTEFCQENALIDYILCSQQWRSSIQ